MVKKKRKTPSARQLEMFRRRERVLELREGGASIRQIAEHLNREAITNGMKTVTYQTVFNDLVAALEDLHENQRMKTKHLVQLQINKLDRLDLAHFSKLLAVQDADSFEKWTRGFERIWKRYDSLLGLHKPVKVELDPRQTLAKLLGRSPEELPNGDSES